MNETPHILRFRAFSHSLDVISSLRPLVKRLKGHDSALVKQLRRAASSVSLNLGESRGRTGGDRLHLLRIAHGSAEEVMACLLVAQAWGYVAEKDVSDVIAQLDGLLAMLASLTR